MPSFVWRRRVAVFLTVASFTVAPAFAASLGPLTSAALFAHNYSGGSGGAITDTFTHPSGTSLATTTDACGDQWTVVGGTFTITSGQTTISATSALVTATVPLCGGSTDVNEEVGGDMHSSGSSVFGLLLNAATGGRPATAVVYNNAGAGTVRLQRLDAAGVATTWATVTGTVNAGNTARFLQAAYRNGVYTIYVNGTSVLTYTVSGATRTAVEANNALGIVAFTDTKSTFDNFQIYPL
jgi:hypothetical protein